MKKIAVVTGSRAEYGLLKNILKMLQIDEDVELCLIVTGAHLSEEFGNSKQEIINDGFLITREIISIDDSSGELSAASSIGIIIRECSEIFIEIKPDILLLLGDRFEILAAAISATLCHIPIAHIHGGEVTLGSMDDTFRHAITKMSHLHFAATKLARNRIIQMGEDPNRTYLVGGLGVDNLSTLKRLSRDALEIKHGIKFSKRNLLVTYHPDTVQPKNSLEQFEELLAVLELQKDSFLLFTAPNIDSGGQELLSRLRHFVASNDNSVLIESLGFEDYISIASLSNAVIGNSSSGLLEIPSLGVGSINIGSRQSGREFASSVINCEPTKESISSALIEILSDKFQESLKNTENPYGTGGASESIYKVLKIINKEQLLSKPFVNIL
ncbi:WecB UDP-N-acetylglucosamine 2-epimerase [Candidatus Nanopelagicaceae bacterium]